MANEDFVDVIKLRVLRWEASPASSRRAQCGPRVLRRGRQERQRQRCDDGRRARDLEEAMLKTWRGGEGRGEVERGEEGQGRGPSQGMWGKAGKQILPYSLSEEPAPRIP